MRSPLHRIRLGACVLVSVFALAVIGYRVIGGYDWVDAIWMVVITISSVGYSERSSFGPTLQIYTIFVILFGMTAAVYTFGGLMQVMIEGELERVIGKRRMTRDLDKLSNHIIICGFGRMGQNLVNDLRSAAQQVVAIDSDPIAVDEAIAAGVLCVHGDATEESLLESVHIRRATTLVTTLPSDAESVFITLTARNLNPSLQIIARAEHQSTEKKLRQAGANKVVMPTIVGARQMVRMITRPTTTDLMELVSESGVADLELDEFLIHEDGALVGVSVGETEAHRRHKLLVIGIKRSGGDLIFNPDANEQFQSQDVVMLMGHAEDIERFRVEFQLS